MPWLAVGIRLPQAQVILGVNVERDLVLGNALVRKLAMRCPAMGPPNSQPVVCASCSGKFHTAWHMLVEY